MRLNRPTLSESYSFGDQTYAREELRAELASVFLAAERGIPHNPEQHAAYVGSWIKALKEDKHEIFRAAHDAAQATDFLLALERDRSIADQTLSAGPSQGHETGARTVEQETENLERDREDETELSSQLEAEREEDREESNLPTAAAAQESTKYAARFEPGAGTVAVERKENGDSHRTPVEQPTGQQKTTTNSPSKDQDELSALRGIVTATLGQKAGLGAAFTDSGTYRGEILGHSDHFVVQRQASGLAIVHDKDRLPQNLEVGKQYSINYNNGTADVRESKQRAKGQELSR